MRWVLVYDVVEDKRRTRLHRRLRGYMEPVQKSVFEGDLDESMRRRVEDLILEELDLTVDDVRMYGLCRGCRTRIVHLGVAAPVADPSVPIVL